MSLQGKIIKNVLYLHSENAIVFIFHDYTRHCIQAKSGYYPYEVKLDYDCKIPYEPTEENSYQI